MELLHVIAYLDEPVVYYGDGMHLDGILSYGAYMNLSYKDRQKIPPISEPWAIDFDLPLEKWFVESETPTHVDNRLFDGEPEQTGDIKVGTLWGWKASAVQADWRCESTFAIRRRVEVDKMVRYTSSPSVNIGAGQQKAVNISLPTRFAIDLHWYTVGDIGLIRRLLGHVKAIGKITTKGPGKVKKWIVERSERNWAIEREGAITRNMPANYPGVGYVANASIRPPYHHFSRIVPAIKPGWQEIANAYF